MNRPGLRTLLLGSRLTAPPIMLGSACVTYRWWEAGGYGLLGFGTIALFIASGNAMGQVNAYRQWRADWAAMGPGGKPSGFRPRPQIIVSMLAALLIGGLIVYASAPDAPPQLHEWLGPVVMGSATLGVALILAGLMWRMWSRMCRQPLPVVTIAIRRPLLRVTSIRGCYRHLPPYCKQLLKGRS